MSVVDEIHKNDIGTKFLLTVKEDGAALDISTCTEKKIIFNKPGGEALVEDATFETDGTDGQIYYLSQTDDLDEVGKWRMQAKVVMSGTWKSNIVTFYVHENLSEDSP